MRRPESCTCDRREKFGCGSIEGLYRFVIHLIGINDCSYGAEETLDVGVTG